MVAISLALCDFKSLAISLFGFKSPAIAILRFGHPRIDSIMNCGRRFCRLVLAAPNGAPPLGSQCVVIYLSHLVSEFFFSLLLVEVFLSSGDLFALLVLSCLLLPCLASRMFNHLLCWHTLLRILHQVFILQDFAFVPLHLSVSLSFSFCPSLLLPLLDDAHPCTTPAR